VASVKTSPDVLLPSSAQRQRLSWRPVPFIGVYSPKLRIKTEAGEQVINLPRVYIIPPTPYIVAVGVALLVLVFGLWRRRARDGWRSYLDEELEGDDRDEDDEYVDGPDAEDR
jgi:hypothetical protein